MSSCGCEVDEQGRVTSFWRNIGHTTPQVQGRGKARMDLTEQETRLIDCCLTEGCGCYHDGEKFCPCREWQPQGFPPITTTIGGRAIRTVAIPGQVILSWTDPPDRVALRINGQQFSVSSPLTLDLTQPGIYNVEVIDPRLTSARFRIRAVARTR